MFSISKETKIEGIEKVGCSLGHIQQCLDDKTKHEKPHYDYFGKTASKGTVILHTCKGDCLLTFEEKNAWAEKVSIGKCENNDI